MRILLMNPNTSADMTSRIAEQARTWAQAGTEIVAVTGGFGSAVIASRASYAIAAHAALDGFAQHHAGMDAVILACFGDPGLAALREVSAVPVIGLAEAAIEEADRRGMPFGILTAGLAWEPMLTEMVSLSRFDRLYRGTFAVDTNGLAFSREPDRFMQHLEAQLVRAEEQQLANVILGGAALAGFGVRLRTSVALIDCMQCAIEAAEESVRHGLIVRQGPVPALESSGLSVQLSNLLRQPLRSP